MIQSINGWVMFTRYLSFDVFPVKTCVYGYTAVDPSVITRKYSRSVNLSHICAVITLKSMKYKGCDNLFRISRVEYGIH